MTYQIIDNFLEEEQFSKIKSSILNPHFLEFNDFGFKFGKKLKNYSYFII